MFTICMTYENARFNEMVENAELEGLRSEHLKDHALNRKPTLFENIGAFLHDVVSSNAHYQNH